MIIEKALRENFGFDKFLKGQKEVVETLLQKKSAVAIFPTGAGKSLCYQLPALLFEGITLVVSPLLSLMKDQLDFLVSKSISAGKLDSTMEKEEYAEVLRKAKVGDLKILMISVERFKNERFRNQLKAMKISLLVVDEAHCISEWGHNFRPEYQKIPIYQKQFGIKQVLLLTATATPRVCDDMCSKFDISEKNVVKTGFYRKNLFLQVSPVSEEKKDQVLLSRIVEDVGAPTIIYVTLQKTAEKVAGMLGANNIPVSFYHAGLCNEDREAIQNRFMNGEIPVIVATIAFGMGIDKKDIRRVIHYDLPKSIESYSQEIGRAGRDGEISFCEVLANRDTIHVLENFVYGDTPEKTSIRKLLQIIKQNPSLILEIKLYSLSSETDIRLLPLKTLLVYLELRDIIRSKHVYFGEYDFKFIKKEQKIVNIFNGERKTFVEAIFENSRTDKVWTKVDVESIVDDYNSPRGRVIAALEYFNEKGWIELRAKQVIDVYEVTNKHFNIDHLTEDLFALVKEKEQSEIKRIYNMVSLFESEFCLNKNLSEYFDKKIQAKCGHCSICEEGQVNIVKTAFNPALTGHDFKRVTSGLFDRAADNEISATVVTRFLCGISSPILRKLYAKKLPEFGLLSKYPYKEVEEWTINNYLV